MFAALIALAILGVIIDAATVDLERRMTVWADRSGMSGMNVTLAVRQAMARQAEGD